MVQVSAFQACIYKDLNLINLWTCQKSEKRKKEINKVEKNYYQMHIFLKWRQYITRTVNLIQNARAYQTIYKCLHPGLICERKAQAVITRYHSLGILSHIDFLTVPAITSPRQSC